MVEHHFAISADLEKASRVPRTIISPELIGCFRLFRNVKATSKNGWSVRTQLTSSTTIMSKSENIR